MGKNQYMNRTGARAKSAMIIRNEYQKQFGIQYYLIVEGESDENFFENILDCSKCKVMNLKGKENVKKFIEERNRANKKGYLGIVDADFEHIDVYEEKINNVILTDFHDIEMMILNSKPNMRRIYSELSDNIIINNFEEKHSKSFIDSIMEAAYEIGLLKMIMRKPRYNVSMKDVVFSDIIDKDFRVNIDELIRRVIKQYHSVYEIKKEIENAREKKYDKYQVCCGHDVTEILAISFISEENDGLGYGNQRYVTKEQIEQLLRVIYDFDYFLKTKMYNEIVEWEKNNDIDILDKNFLKVA